MPIATSQTPDLSTRPGARHDEEGDLMSEPIRPAVPRAVVLPLAGLLAILLVLAAFQGVRRLTHHSVAPAGLSRAEQSAVDAAKQETINIQTYRLKSFDADFAAAVSGLTPAKATQWQANRATLKTRLTQLKQDAGATVSGAGLVSFDGRTAVVVVSSDTLKVDSAGKSTTAAQNRSQVTMKLMNGRWLMDELLSVSVS
jgi:hypothetical protein